MEVNMTNLEKLTDVLMSGNVKNGFYNLLKDKSFKLWILNLIPEIVDCKNCKQNTPWHLYNVLDHILISVEQINKLTANMEYKKRKMFSYIMFLHDLGKPKCKQHYLFKGKTFDTFPNHQQESEIIAKRVLSKLGFSEKEVKLMCTLILNHDLFNKIVKEPKRIDQKKFCDELIKSLVSNFNTFGDGIDILNSIVIIGIADNKAQNAELTKKPLEILEETILILNKLKKNENQM